MKTMKKKCRYCTKPINIVIETLGGGYGKMYRQSSEEGICIENDWFCMECWETYFKPVALQAQQRVLDDLKETIRRYEEAK